MKSITEQGDTRRGAAMRHWRMVIAGAALLAATLAAVPGRAYACCNPLYVGTGTDVLRFCYDSSIDAYEYRRPADPTPQTFASVGVTVRDIKFGPDGNLYVLTAANDVRRFDGNTGQYMGVFVTPGSGGLDTTPLNHWSRAHMAFGPGGDLYIVNTGSQPDGYVKRYHGDSGLFIDNFVSSLERPAGLAFDCRQEKLYVAVTGQVSRAGDLGGGVVRVLGPGGDDVGYLKEYDARTGAFIRNALGGDHFNDGLFSPIGVAFNCDLPLVETIYVSFSAGQVYYASARDLPNVGALGSFAHPCGNKIADAPDDMVFQHDQSGPGPYAEIVRLYDCQNEGAGHYTTIGRFDYLTPDSPQIFVDRAFGEINGMAFHEAPGGISCDDHNACTVNEVCGGGGSAGYCNGASLDCEDHNDCTSDSCDHDSGCTHTPLTGTSCTDNNVCTTNDTCQNGTCVSGPPPDCHDIPTDNPCTIDSCDPVNGGCQNALVPGCDPAASKGTFVGGPNHTCTNGTYDSNTNTCTISSPTVDLAIPLDDLPNPINVNLVKTAPDPAGTCDFALRNSIGRVAACIQLEPSGQQFPTHVTATFKWTNVASTACSRANCCVDATGAGGASTKLNEGTLTVFTQGKCLPGAAPRKCEGTNKVCVGDKDCPIALTGACGDNQGTVQAPTLCPVCPGNKGCLTGTTLDYSTCTSPCVGPAKCDPAANSWTVKLSHFSQYAVGFVPPPPDDFQCYQARNLSTTPVTSPVSLVDQFGTVSAKVIKPLKLCSPTNANGENADALSHADYLQSYALQLLNRKELEARLPVRRQKVTDRFGSLFVDVRLPDRLLVPTSTNVDSQPAAPSSSTLDHFTCYKIKRTKGTARFTPTGVAVEDRFDQFTATVRVKQPTHLCVPTNKNNESPGAEHNPGQLMCYRASPPFVQVRRQFTSNELGPSFVYPLFREELCVPALLG